MTGHVVLIGAEEVTKASARIADAAANFAMASARLEETMRSATRAMEELSAALREEQAEREKAKGF